MADDSGCQQQSLYLRVLVTTGRRMPFASATRLHLVSVRVCREENGRYEHDEMCCLAFDALCM